MNRWLSKLVVGLVPCLALTFSLWAYGEDQDLQVGVEEVHNYPYYGLHKGKHVGIGRDVMDRFAATQELEFQYKIYPVERLFRTFLKKAVDFKYPDSPLWRKELKGDTKIYYSKPIAKFIDGTMVKPELKGKGVKRIKKLATIRGFTAWSYLDKIKSGAIELVQEEKIRNVIRLVVNGTVDAAYVNVEVANYLMNHKLHTPGALVFDPELPHDKGGYRVSSIKYPKMIDKLNQFLESTNVRNETLRKYGVEPQFGNQQPKRAH